MCRLLFSSFAVIFTTLVGSQYSLVQGGDDLKQIDEARETLQETMLQADLVATMRRADAGGVRLSRGIDWLINQVFEQGVQKAAKGDFDGADAFFTATVNGTERRIPLTETDVLRAYQADAMRVVQEHADRSRQIMLNLTQALRGKQVELEKQADEYRDSAIAFSRTEEEKKSEFANEEEHWIDSIARWNREIDQGSKTDEQLMSLYSTMTRQKDALELLREQYNDQNRAMEQEKQRRREEQRRLAEEREKHNKTVRDFNKRIEHTMRDFRTISPGFKSNRTKLRQWAPTFKDKIMNYKSN